MLKTAAVFLVLFSLLAVPAFADSLVIGIAPASQTVCASPSGSGLVKFLISTNIDLTQNVTLGFEPNWVTGERLLFVTRTLNYNATIKLPPNTPKGDYAINVIACRLPDPRLNESLATASCVAPTIQVSVQDSCPDAYVEPAAPVKIDETTIAAALIVASALCITGYAILRKR